MHHCEMNQFNLFSKFKLFSQSRVAFKTKGGNKQNFLKMQARQDNKSIMTKSQKVSFGRKSKSHFWQKVEVTLLASIWPKISYTRSFGLCVHATVHVTAEKKKQNTQWCILKHCFLVMIRLIDHLKRCKLSSICIKF